MDYGFEWETEGGGGYPPHRTVTAPESHMNEVAGTFSSDVA